MGLKKKQIQKYLEKYPEMTTKQIREYWSAFQLFLKDGIYGDKRQPKDKDAVEPIKLKEQNKQVEEDECSITIDILAKIMRRMFQNPTETELLDMVREVDSDGSGNIEFDEFVELMANSNKKLDSKYEMYEAFKVFDQDNDQVISKEELQKVFRHIGCELTEEECDMMIKEVDTTGTNTIHYEDFIKLMAMSKRDIQCWNEKKSDRKSVV